MTNVSLKSLKQTRALSAVRVSWAGCTILCANRSIKGTEGSFILTKPLHLFPALWVAGDITPLYYRLKIPKVLSGTILVFFFFWKCEGIWVAGCTEFNFELKINLFLTVTVKKMQWMMACLSKPRYIHQSWFGILILLFSCKKPFHR